MGVDLYLCVGFRFISEFTSEKQCNNAQDQISQVKGKLHYEDSPKFIMVCVPK